MVASILDYIREDLRLCKWTVVSGCCRNKNKQNCRMFDLYAIVCLSLAAARAGGATVGHNVFGHRVTKGQVTAPEIAEVTGMAVSRVHNDVMYVHNHQTDGNFLYAIDINTGAELAKFTIQGARNYDWEDMAVGPCVSDCQQSTCSAANPPQNYCLYIADIGGHSGDGAADVVYMVKEPTDLQSGDLSVVDSLTFSWSEQDVETLMVSPDARLFVISKIDTGRAVIAELPKSAWGKTVTLDLANTGILKIFTDHHDPQGGDISPDGKEILIVAEEEVFYYSVSDGDYINAVRTSVPESITSYTSLPNTEAIAWAPHGQGFYSLARGADQFIYFYPKDDLAGAVVG